MIKIGVLHVNQVLIRCIRLILVGSWKYVVPSNAIDLTYSNTNRQTQYAFPSNVPLNDPLRSLKGPSNAHVSLLNLSPTQFTLPFDTTFHTVFTLVAKNSVFAAMRSCETAVMLLQSAYKTPTTTKLMMCLHVSTISYCTSQCRDFTILFVFCAETHIQCVFVWGWHIHVFKVQQEK